MKAKRRCLANFEARSVMLFAAWAIGGAAGVHAQTPSPAPSRPATQVNTPASKAVPPAAAGPDAGAAFTRADANKDGRLNPEEAELLPAVGQRFDMLDSNRDGFLSREEFDKGLKP